MKVLGIDIGSYGIKAAVVDTETGEMLSRKKTSKDITDFSPHKVIAIVHEIVNTFGWDGIIGCAFPEPTRNGIVISASRLKEDWVDADANHLFSEITGCPVYVIKDADAGGLAELSFGSGKHETGTVLMLTIGTGIGSSLFINGRLVPNTELGYVELKGISIEERASNRTRKEEGISRKIWGKRLEYVLEHYEKLLHPDLIILGGQLSRKADKTFPFIKIHTKLKPAAFQNDATIIGAAIYAAGVHEEEKIFYH